MTKDQICVFPSGRYLLNMIDKGNLTRTTLLRGYTPSDQIYQNHNPNVSASQGGFNCSSLPAGLGGNGEFERKFEEILGNLRGNSSGKSQLGAKPHNKSHPALHSAEVLYTSRNISHSHLVKDLCIHKK